ncbi:hypothetical protein C0991_010066 [Blastosporella zonata]|nr:hypothetical protein C0991_010066 [Blastosporella zonata]
MFSYLRLAPRCVRTCPRPAPHYQLRRTISYTPTARTELAPEPPSELEENLEQDELQGLSEKGPRNESRDIDSYKEFIKTSGEKFREANKANNWLGGEPFPMNPSFRPPPPVSDADRTAMFDAYMTDPIKNDVRALSQMYHLSLKRVDAILRLKGMEADWLKDKPLQTGFLKGMEFLLDVRRRVQHTTDRSDVHEADMLEQDENRDAARQRYQQLYWESVPEDGREPIVPASLEHAKKTAKRYTELREAYKSNPQLMPHVVDITTQTPAEKIQVVTKPGRPSLKFVDVGGHFIDVEERLKRIAESERRAKIVARKEAERKEAQAARRRQRSSRSKN